MRQILKLETVNLCKRRYSYSMTCKSVAGYSEVAPINVLFNYFIVMRYNTSLKIK